MPERFETVVVGAGISGLAYAHARGSHADLVVLESAMRVGGLVHTAAFDTTPTVRYECGPEALRFEAQGGLRDMLAELGLQAEQPPRASRRRYLVCRGKLVEAPLGVWKFLRTPLLSWRGKLRMLREPWRDRREGNAGSVADFVRHRLGEEALEALLDPLVSGIHAGVPEQLSMRACFPRLVELVERYGGLFYAQWKTRGSPAPSVMKPAGGCESIIAALRVELGTKIRCDTPVQAISRSAEEWKIETSRGSIVAKRLVLAVSAAAAARLLEDCAPQLGQLLATMTSESLVSLVHVYGRDQVEHPLRGFGYLVPAREGMRHLGTLFSSSIAPDSAPPNRVVLRTLLGGARRQELLHASEQELLDIVQQEVHPLLGIRGAARHVAVQRWPGTLPRFDLQHPQRVQAIESNLPPQLHLLGNYLRGIGVNHLAAAARALARQHDASSSASV